MLAAAEIYRMEFSGNPTLPPIQPISTIFAFGSDLTGDPQHELDRLLSVSRELNLHFQDPCPELPCPISALCIVGRGTWTWGKLPQDTESQWHRSTMHDPQDEILLFLGAASNTCFNVHANRQGRPPEVQTVGGGIGNLILSEQSYEPAV
jgi:hypothetical protein